MRAIMNHVVFEFKYILRDKTLFFMSYLFPLVFYVMMGMVMTSINPEFHKTIIPAMIVFAALVSTLLGMPTPVVQGRESGIFRSYKINGMPKLSVLLIPAVTTFFHMIIVSVIIAVSAPCLFKGVMPQKMGMMILGFFALSIATTGIGILIATIAKNNRAAIILAQIIFVPSMILGGIMMPASILPENMGRLSRIFPSTYAMNVFSNAMAGGKQQYDTGLSLAIMVIAGLLSFWISYYLFKWDNGEKKKNVFLAVLALLPYIVGMVVL